MYKGYIAICHPDEQHLTMVEKLVEMSTTLAIKEWRRLPRIVNHIHTPYLQVIHYHPFHLLTKHLYVPTASHWTKPLSSSGLPILACVIASPQSSP